MGHAPQHKEPVESIFTGYQAAHWLFNSWVQRSSLLIFPGSGRTFHERMKVGSREMAQKLGALAALSEDHGSISVTYMVVHNCL